MLHEVRQNFIHEHARILCEKMGSELTTPELFEIVKHIIDKYDETNGKVHGLRVAIVGAHDFGDGIDGAELERILTGFDNVPMLIIDQDMPKLSERLDDLNNDIRMICPKQIDYAPLFKEPKPRQDRNVLRHTRRTQKHL